MGVSGRYAGGTKKIAGAIAMNLPANVQEKQKGIEGRESAGWITNARFSRSYCALCHVRLEKPCVWEACC